MKSVLLVDLSGIFWANWHASADEELSTAFKKTVSRIQGLRNGYDHVAICCDAPPYWRKKILPTYKAQRDAPPPQAVEQLTRVKKRLTSDGLLLWSSDGFEADDVIATATRCAKEDHLAVTIASSDKDLLQLVDDDADVRVLSPASGAVFRREQVLEKFGVTPDMMLDLLSLTGDTSDNVPGVKGVGPKKAAALLLQFGSFDDVFNNVDKVTQPKLLESLVEGGPAARLARQVIRLRDDVPINWSELFLARIPQPLCEPTYEESEDMDQPNEAPESELESGPTNDAPLAVLPPPTAITRHEDPKLSDTVMMVRTEPDWNFGLEPNTLKAAHELAKGLANSRLYSRLPNAEAIWAIIIRGREMGLGALTALDNFHLVEGKPAPHAHLLIARAKGHPDCKYFQFLGGDGTYAEYETHNRRNPKPTRLKYTIDQARKAGLVKAGGNWDKRPDEMLRKTCGVQLARLEYPDSTQGLYAMEELGSDAA